MPDQDRKTLIDEASSIFVRLREDPENASLLAERKAFQDRGETEREIYAHVAKAWAGVGRKPGPNTPLMVALLAGVLALGLLVTKPARNLFLADIATRFETLETDLASGDRVVLDADTALSDDTDGAERQVTLFDGAALFDVEKDGRPFVVQAGDLTIEVLGTTFEASRINESVAVSVSEGRVRVSTPDREWTLDAGDYLLWSGQTGGQVVEIEPRAVALWRDDRIVADGLTFGQLADVIDRRLPGKIVFGQAALSDARVSGTVSLKNPEAALRAVAAARDARVISLGPLGHLILP
ncbi:MAG: FecR domain-containing protein [Pseudomonadota bacterium]